MTDLSTDELLERYASSQCSKLNMVAASSIKPLAVRHAMSSEIAAVVAEGYRESRYHLGTNEYDEIELLGETIAKRVFNVDYVNLKPHSGSQAIQSVLLALQKCGFKTVLSLDLGSGGHISHSPVMAFNQLLDLEFVHYQLREDFRFDYDRFREKAAHSRADVFLIGGSSYPKQFDWNTLYEIACEIGAQLVADISHVCGLIAGDSYSFETHEGMIIASSTSKTLPGPVGGMIMAKGVASPITNAINKAVNIGLQSEDNAACVVGKVAVLQLAETEEFSIVSKNIVQSAKELARCCAARGLDVCGYTDIDNGTDTHMVLLKLGDDPAISGRVIANSLESVGIICNKNVVPGDSRSPSETSGVRLGTTNFALHGIPVHLASELADILAHLISLGITSCDSRQTLNELRSRVCGVRDQGVWCVLDGITS